MDLKDKMNQIYGNAHSDKIPWNIEQPPRQLVDLIESRKVTPCRAIDLGCGIGNYVIWLADKGFHTTGIDFSEKAIELARRNAEQKGVNCRFFVGDLTSTDFVADTDYEFAYDWEVLHHIFPENRNIYIQNVLKTLKKGGIYFSVCFSEQDPDFGGEGKYRKTPLDTLLYFSSETEVEELLQTNFEIQDLTTIEISGKYGPHIAIMALAIKL